MKKKLPLIILLGAAAAVLLGLLVYFGLQQTPSAEEETSSAASPSSALEEGEAEPGVLGGMLPPENDADVLDNLAFAISESPDAVAWLQVPGTDINGVVMQGNDNLYYERRNEDGNYDIYGCYYADYECSLGGREDFSQNTVIYGHGNSTDDKDGKRFSQLFRFTEADFAREHPYIYLTTQDEKFVFQIFSVFYTDVNFDYIRVVMEDEEKLALAKEAEALSLYDYGLTLSEEDKILTLSTCSRGTQTDNTHRFVVMGRLCPADYAQMQQAVLSVRAPSSSAE